MSLIPSPDAHAVVAAVDRLTTQVQRLADTLSTGTAALGDAPTTTADDALPRHMERHDDGRLHCRTCNTTGVFPGLPLHDWQCPDRPAARRPPMDPVHILGIDPSSPEGVAVQPAPAAEEQQRTERRRSLRNLLDRLDRSTVHTWSEGNMLRAHIETEMHEADTLRAITADHRVETRALREKLERYGQEAKEQRERAEQAEAAIERVRAYAAETARSMKDATNDHDIGRYDTAVCVLDALREDAERFDEAEDVESLRAKLDEATATLRRVRALHARVTVRTTGGPADACDSCENDGMSHPWPCPTAEALAGPHPDRAEQATTKEPS